MGVDYNAVIGVGKTFDDEHEAVDFLEKHNVLTTKDRDEIEEDGLAEWLYNSNKVNGLLLDYYGYGWYFVGYEISCSNPDAFKQSFDEGMKRWAELFVGVEPEVVKTVQVC